MATDLSIGVRKVASVNPATGEVVGEFNCGSEQEIHAAVERASAAQVLWNQQPPSRRIEILHSFQRLLHERKSDVARLITREVGKPYVEALLTEVMVVLDATRFHIEQSQSLLRDQPVP